MAIATPEPIHLSDYTVPAYLVDHVDLTFHLHPTETRVTSRIQFRPNPATDDRHFFLHGEQLNLISAKIDGVDVSPSFSDDGLTCEVPNSAFVWEAVVEISPSTNTALSGLYMSNGMYCTQCEAEGFRRITYYPDRPDVMAVFDVTIHTALPHALSNGEVVSSQDGIAKWADPWPKPAYLFALVAGDFMIHSDSFTTMSGKDVDLNIYVRSGDENKCDFAMASLKASMSWDEEVYGREYDLSVFNIVAVDDFNMGAMENKGLNIFNSSAVLADKNTSTDANFERIEAIVAHEYFHNWTGNRITCRDWFQLSLKEGLTVYRDHQFSADIRSPDVRRIEDVIALRGRQFREDNGPLAHPVRPASFVEINNFYTSTIYEKGAEVIRMLHTLVGDDAYAAALDLYFTRHDGQACTIEDWLQVFEDTTGRDLSQFKLWYSQAGTPRVRVDEDFTDGTYSVTFTQSIPDTPGQSDKQPMVIPISLGLIDPSGAEVASTQVLELTETQQTFTFAGLDRKPVPSLLRGFSAPVVLHHDMSAKERLTLLSHDTDMFNRWEATRQLGRDVLLNMVDGGTADDEFVNALITLAADETLDPAFRALCLTLPAQDDIAQVIADANGCPNPMIIDAAHNTLADQIATQGQATFDRLHRTHHVTGHYSPDAVSCAHRALANCVLGYLSRVDGGALAGDQFASANNMTVQLAALAATLKAGVGDVPVTEFYDQWRHERLVVDKWFSVQIGSCPAETAVDVARELAQHPDFTLTNPNRFRALIGPLAMRPAAFHRADGAAYEFVADQLIALDDINPQTTARMTTVFETWKRYDVDRQDMMRAALRRIAAKPNLSRDTGEMVTRLLNA